MTAAATIATRQNRHFRAMERQATVLVKPPIRMACAIRDRPRDRVVGEWRRSGATELDQCATAPERNTPSQHVRGPAAARPAPSRTPLAPGDATACTTPRSRPRTARSSEDQRDTPISVIPLTAGSGHGYQHGHLGPPTRAPAAPVCGPRRRRHQVQRSYLRVPGGSAQALSVAPGSGARGRREPVGRQVSEADSSRPSSDPTSTQPLTRRAHTATSWSRPR